MMTGTEIYDLLMQDIEPELTSSRVHGLKEKYANETPEEHAERMARYDRAFGEYERTKERYLSALHHNRQHDRQALEESDRQREQAQLIALESSFTS